MSRWGLHFSGEYKRWSREITLNVPKWCKRLRVEGLGLAKSGNVRSFVVKLDGQDISNRVSVHKDQLIFWDTLFHDAEEVEHNAPLLDFFRVPKKIVRRPRRYRVKIEIVYNDIVGVVR